MVLSMIPTPSAPQIEEKIEFRLDYIEHFMVFIPLGFIWVARRKSLMITLIVLLVAGAVPEIVQIAVPYRRFNPIDLTINMLGTATGYLFGYIYPFKLLITVPQIPGPNPD